MGISVSTLQVVTKQHKIFVHNTLVQILPPIVLKMSPTLEIQNNETTNDEVDYIKALSRIYGSHTYFNQDKIEKNKEDKSSNEKIKNFNSSQKEIDSDWELKIVDSPNDDYEYIRAKNSYYNGDSSSDCKTN